MLVFEDPDDDRLYLGRAIPRTWIASGKPIAIQAAPTRWDRVDYQLATAASEATAKIEITIGRTPPKEIQATYRIPAGKTLSSLGVNGLPVRPSGAHSDAALFPTAGQRESEVIARWT